ncbi:hypothetical protein CYMTET_27626 [Cymbomonas tetramitiformis]|uniref:Fungal lipase-type domain-containing protein n=1 Tax=Cymbomonas tetramitiformis TaxID=36881 RepID=A0AAE0FPG4_9CHLO|nr:hypothetical protein CYMTET_27626 [Cymbomonas tetramitiformis]
MAQDTFNKGEMDNNWADLDHSLNDKSTQTGVPGIVLYETMSLPAAMQLVLFLHLVFTCAMFSPDSRTGRRNVPKLPLQTVHTLVVLSKAAYLMKISRNVDNCSVPGFSTEGFFFDEETDTAVCLFRRGDVVVVAFRGTHSQKNLCTDIQTWLTRFPCRPRRAFQLAHASAAEGSLVRWAEPSVSGRLGSPRAAHWLQLPRGNEDSLGERNLWNRMFFAPRVHHGFWDAYCSVQEDLDEALHAVISSRAEAEMPVRQVIFTGHSLGGALSALGAVQCAMHWENGEVPGCKTEVPPPAPEVKLCTFGMPRVGNADFGRLLEAALTTSIRVVNAGDVVPGLIKHVGFVPSCVNFFPKFRHCGTLVVLSRDGDCALQPTELEQRSVLHIRTSITDHYSEEYQKNIQRTARRLSRIRVSDVARSRQHQKSPLDDDDDGHRIAARGDDDDVEGARSFWPPSVSHYNADGDQRGRRRDALGEKGEGRAQWSPRALWRTGSERPRSSSSTSSNTPRAQPRSIHWLGPTSTQGPRACVDTPKEELRLNEGDMQTGDMSDLRPRRLVMSEQDKSMHGHEGNTDV